MDVWWLLFLHTITSKSLQNTVSDCEIAVIFLKKHGDKQHSRHKSTFALRHRIEGSFDRLSSECQNLHSDIGLVGWLYMLLSELNLLNLLNLLNSKLKTELILKSASKVLWVVELSEFSE